MTDDISPIDEKDLIARDDARQGFNARERDYPDLRIPPPEEVLGNICPICRGTTWVVRANAELEGPIMAELVACDNPKCPQRAAFGVRDIMHLALPYNKFNDVIQLPSSGQILALEKKE